MLIVEALASSVCGSVVHVVLLPGVPLLVVYCTLYWYSVVALSVQFRSSAVPLGVAVSPVGASGTASLAWKITGRMKSFSSCPRMWQCHTYSQP